MNRISTKNLATSNLLRSYTKALNALKRLTMSAFVPTTFNYENQKSVYDYAVFIDRYNRTDTLNKGEGKFVGYEYSLYTLNNGYQVMYEEDNNDIKHAYMLRLCAELVVDSKPVFALVEIGNDYGKILNVFREEELKLQVSPEIYDSLLKSHKAHCDYKDDKESIDEIDKDIEELSSEQGSIKSITIEMVRDEIYNEIMSVLNKYKCNKHNVDIKMTSTSYKGAIDTKLKKLQQKKSMLLTPGVKSIM